ncbi:MAG TPA: lipoyl domain-containing protein [Acidisoma sp.]|jgi:pyruvate/2-oxoglutarate dehydrogenase complex dihydrolipoamide acyltransferase (E2) component|nr:lipoyl domain-containing protein [Acidisoma sp.]
MTDISLNEDLWRNSMLPEGILERWYVTNGAEVAPGEKIAEVRIESALHEIMAPAAGRITILTEPNAVVEPGSVVGRLAH